MMHTAACPAKVKPGCAEFIAPFAIEPGRPSYLIPPRASFLRAERGTSTAL